MSSTLYSIKAYYIFHLFCSLLIWKRESLKTKGLQEHMTNKVDLNAIYHEKCKHEIRKQEVWQIYIQLTILYPCYDMLIFLKYETLSVSQYVRIFQFLLVTQIGMFPLPFTE